MVTVVEKEFLSDDEPPRRPILFLGVDGVLALNDVYSGRDAKRAVNQPSKVPPDFHERLFARTAGAALNQLLSDFMPRVVLTSSWLRLLDRDSFLWLFEEGGIDIKFGDLHPAWDAPEIYGLGRGARISDWLSKNYRGEGFLILDGESSGATLVDTPWMKSGYVVLCQEGVGFHVGLLGATRAALSQPPLPNFVWTEPPRQPQLAPTFEPDQRQRQLVEEAKRLNARAMEPGHFVPPSLRAACSPKQKCSRRLAAELTLREAGVVVKARRASMSRRFPRNFRRFSLVDEYRCERKVTCSEAFRNEQRPRHVPEQFGTPSRCQRAEHSHTFVGRPRVTDQVVRAGLGHDELPGNMHGLDR